jgi:hypothetical protein
MSLRVKARAVETVKVKDRAMASNGSRYNVGGVLLPRPFKVRRLGHFGLVWGEVARI